MIDPSFRDELLKQNGAATMEAQLKVLDDLVQADRRYIRRLTIATIAVWAVWVSMMAVSLGLPMILGATASPTTNQPPVSSTTTTTLPLPIPEQGPSYSGGAWRGGAGIFAVIVLVIFFSLPIAGVILIVMLITTRRTATMGEIQASLVSINAQLKMILSEKKPSTDPQG
jgi:hypothetical protein